jgi:hypothetical protein
MDDDVVRRVTILETQFSALGRRIDEHIDKTNKLIERLDERADRADILQARLLGGLIVAQFLAILFAPALRAALGLDS